MKKRNLYIIVNLIYVLYCISLMTPNVALFQSMVINLIIYVIPGLSWMGLFNQKQDFIVFVFLSFCLSTTIWLGINAAVSLFQLPIHPLTFLTFLLLISNTGVFLKGDRIAFPRTFTKKKSLYIVSYIALIGLMITYGMRTIKPLKDLDGEHFGTSYGLVKELKPYLNSDIIASNYYFAHPPLSNIFNAYSLLLFNKIDDYKFYYDSAKKAQAVIDSKIGERITINFPGRTCHFYKRGKQSYQITEEHGPIIIKKNNFDLIQYFHRRDHEQFDHLPNVFFTRASNLYPNLLAGLILFSLTFHFTKSIMPSTLAGFAYFSSPGIFVRVCLSEHLAFTNCFILLIAYQFLFPSKFQGSRQFKFIRFLPAFIAGLINQKIIILILSIILIHLYRFFKRRGRFSLTAFLNYEPIVTGYFLGTMIFWAYGLIISTDAFLVSHLHTHFFDRLFHINTMFKEDYPSIVRLWLDFIVEFPFIVITLISFFGAWKTFTQNNLKVTYLYPLVGGVVFSLVDWKQTNHLMCLVPILLLPIFIFHIKLKSKRPFYGLFLGLIILIIAWNVHFNIDILNDFDAYLPKSGW